MKKLFLFAALALVACNSNKDERFCECLSVGEELNVEASKYGAVALDEITAERDCEALLNAGWCGISLLATAHASGKRDFMERPIYRPLVESRLFDTLLILQTDKSWRIERVKYDN